MIFDDNNIYEVSVKIQRDDIPDLIRVLLPQARIVDSLNSVCIHVDDTLVGIWSVIHKILFFVKSDAVDIKKINTECKKMCTEGVLQKYGRRNYTYNKI